MVDRPSPTQKASEVLRGEGDREPPADRTVRLEGWFPINPRAPSKPKGKGREDEEAKWPDMGTAFLNKQLYLYGVRDFEKALGRLYVLPADIAFAVKYAGPFYAPVEVRAVIDVKDGGNPVPFWIETEHAVKLAKMIEDYQAELSKFEGETSTIFLCDKFKHENTELTLQED